VLDTYLSGVEQHGRTEWKALCPVHEDRKVPNLCISVKKLYGVGPLASYFSCKQCHANGDAVLVALGLSEHRQSIFHDGLDGFNAPPERPHPLPSDDQIARCSDALFANSELLRYVTEARGVSEEVARDVGLGWHEGWECYLLPVRDETGDVVNVRCHRPDGKPKMRNWKGHGDPPRLYPAPPPSDAKAVVVAEGEWDVLVARSNGLTAVCGTHGAGTWLAEWSAALAGKHVRFVYDCDDAGRAGAAKAAESVRRSAKSVGIVDLGLGDKEDLSDWFVKYGYSRDELRALLNDKSFAGGA
jgi:hypothetical protein